MKAAQPGPATGGAAAPAVQEDPRGHQGHPHSHAVRLATRERTVACRDRRAETVASSRPVGTPNAQQRSEALKERVYVTSTVLAVTIAYERDAGHATVDDAALTLLFTVLGTLMAVFVADVVAHMVRDGMLPSGRELAHLAYVSFGSSGVVVVPMGILAISAAGGIDVATALHAISATLAATLVFVTLLAVRRLRVGPWRKALALAITTALGLGALCIELSVH